MTKTVITRCDNCTKELDTAEGWHLVLNTWFVPVEKTGNSMTLEHREYVEPIKSPMHFCNRECLRMWAKE